MKSSSSLTADLRPRRQQDVFWDVPLGPAQWLFLLCIPLALILLDEGRKWLIRHH
ncbi:hypothetical protein [Limosilactobacillus fermentum]